MDSLSNILIYTDLEINITGLTPENLHDCSSRMQSKKMEKMVSLYTKEVKKLIQITDPDLLEIPYMNL